MRAWESGSQHQRAAARIDFSAMRAWENDTLSPYLVCIFVPIQPARICVYVGAWENDELLNFETFETPRCDMSVICSEFSHPIVVGLMMCISQRNKIHIFVKQGYFNLYHCECD